MTDRQRESLMQALLPTVEEARMMGRVVVKVESRKRNWTQWLRRSR